MHTIALGGNPNCGKSTLFNQLTGIRQTTGNWPGVTVERKEGYFRLAGKEVKVVDLPGIYSLDASSIDEQVTLDYLLSGDSELIINVLDAGNLERNLYFTIQLREMGIPMVVVLNMMDVAVKHGITIDVEALSEKLSCPVVPIVAVSGEGVEQLEAKITATLSEKKAIGFQIAYEQTVEEAIGDISQLLLSSTGPTNAGLTGNMRCRVLKLLEGDEFAMASVGEAMHSMITAWQAKIKDRSDEDADIHIAGARYNYAHSLAKIVIKDAGKLEQTLSDKIDRVVLHRFVGVPIFLFVMYLMFMFTINIGGAFIDFFDMAVGAIAVDGLGVVLSVIGLPELFRVLLANGIGGGIQVVSTFIPIITCLYLFLSVIEDTGYMARAAFVMDRAMQAIGLPGKAFVPMIVGFGCNVPAVMATRTLENQRERKLTILMNPFMSCGARLPVYVLFAAAFFPENGQNLIFLLYLIGILVAVLTGMIMRRTLLTGQSAGFMMELPPYHVPTLKGVLLRTWDRVKLFIRDAGKVIVVMVLALNVLNSIGTDGSFGHENSEESILSASGKLLTPLLSPIGIKEDNWPATVGVFTGILAKEAVVGTLDSIYAQMAAEKAGVLADQEVFEFWLAMEKAWQTIPENLASVTDMVLDPLGLDVGDISSAESAADEQGLSLDTLSVMTEHFDGQIGAFAYLLFILLYFPCVATIGVIVRETDGAWAMFVALWTTGVAFTASTLFYQIATFNRHVTSSTGWIVGLSVLMMVTIMLLRNWSRKAEPVTATAKPREVVA
jgi:ferrous iron transport protein B